MDESHVAVATGDDATPRAAPVDGNSTAAADAAETSVSPPRAAASLRGIPAEDTTRTGLEVPSPFVISLPTLACASVPRCTLTTDRCAKVSDTESAVSVMSAISRCQTPVGSPGRVFLDGSPERAYRPIGWLR